MNHFKKICNYYGCYHSSERNELFCSKHMKNEVRKKVKTYDSGVTIYQSVSGTDVVVEFDDNEVWLSQSSIAQLYGKPEHVIKEHIHSTLESEDTDTTEVVRTFLVTESHHKAPSDPQTKGIKHYNFDMIHKIGMRIDSKEAMCFKRWTKGQVRSVPQVNYSVPSNIGEWEATRMSEIAKGLKEQGVEVFDSIVKILVDADDHTDRDCDVVLTLISTSLLYQVTRFAPNRLVLKRLDRSQPNCGLNPGVDVTVHGASTPINYLTKDEHERYIQLLHNCLESMWTYISKVDTYVMDNIVEVYIKEIKCNGRPLHNGGDAGFKKTNQIIHTRVYNYKNYMF